MQHDVIDNRNRKLVDHIRKILPTSKAARFAVGYFFLSGFEAVVDVLDHVDEIRILIGNIANRQTIEQIAEGYRRLEQVKNAAEEIAYPKKIQIEDYLDQTGNNIGDSIAIMNQTDDAQHLAEALVRLIEEDRLHVRVYTKGRLHAKAYIFDYGPTYDESGNQHERIENGIAVVGSSNFTLSGITTNTELNVIVHGNSNHAALKLWFEELWDEGEDFNEHLIDELRSSWAMAEVSPYEIYLKTLYELVRDQIEDEQAETFLWRGDITSVLTEFQERAARRAIRMIHRYDGCFVADVVGTGKSYIGAAITKHFERNYRKRPLIVCPAGLIEMWEHYNEAYQLNARVLSMGKLVEDEEFGPDWMLHDERFRYRDFVLIDESHNFRNTDNQRYRVLRSFLAASHRPCVLLTATPRNKSLKDIHNQIKLFHPEDVTDLPIDPPNLREYFKLVESGKKRIQTLLSEILIRRTRNHILRWYGYDAETEQRVDPDNFTPYRTGERRAYILVGDRKQFFPRRELHTIQYSIEDTYQGLYKRLRSHLGKPQQSIMGVEEKQLTYARYGLWNYVKESKQQEPPYAELQRAGANLRGLMRIMLFKRFESSVEAFRQTLKRMLRIHSRFLQALDGGIVPAGEDAQDLLYESDQLEEQALVDALEEASERYSIRDFRVSELRNDIEHDLGILRRMHDLVKNISPIEDDKLQTLAAWLNKEPLDKGKRLIFTQYADTARYIYGHLDPRDDHPEVEVIYGSEKSRASVVARFAPKSNPAHPLPKGTREIKTLIATDVLSEGLNLQDGDKVVNYDLHWNPVRLIQRFGRIDRIGSEHEVIHGFNFLPETALERQLGLQEKLSERIQEIHDTIGEDAAILDPSEQLNEEAMYAIYSEGDISAYEEDDLDEFVDLNEAEEIIRQLQEDEPERFNRIVNLRDGVRCGYRVGQQGIYVFCRAGRYRQLFLVDERGEIITRELPRVLSRIKCDPGTPSARIPANYNEQVMRIKKRFSDEVKARLAEQRHTVSLTKAQQYIRKELHIFYTQQNDENVRHQIDLLLGAFTQPAPRPAIRVELNRIHRLKLAGERLVEDLSNTYHLYDVETSTRRQQYTDNENDALPRIICSEALFE